MNLAIGLILAIASAGLLNTSFFLQHRAANRIDLLNLRHPLFAIRALFSDPAWFLAYSGGWIGWGAYVAALHFAPLSVVQAAAAGGFGLLAWLAHVWGLPLGRAERIAALLAVGGLLLICLSLIVKPTDGRAHLDVLLELVAIGLALGGILIGPARRRLRPGAGLGAAAGLCYAVGDIATKGALSGTSLLLVPILLLCNIFGFALLQAALQRGSVLVTAGLSSVVTSSIPIAAGIFVFGEALPDDPAGWARGAGFGLCIVGAFVLAGFGHKREEGESAARASQGTCRRSTTL